MWINRFLFLTKRLWTLLKILFRTKQSPVMANILPGWINKLKHLLWKKPLYINVWSSVKQCSLIHNGRTLPSLFPLITKKSFLGVDFSIEDIKNIFSKLDSNKAYGDDMISIRMFNLFDKSICKTRNIIFKSGLMQGIFPSEWKKANVVPIHKKATNSALKITDLFSESAAKF